MCLTKRMQPLQEHDWLKFNNLIAYQRGLKLNYLDCGLLTVSRWGEDLNLKWREVPIFFKISTTCLEKNFAFQYPVSELNFGKQ